VAQSPGSPASFQGNGYDPYDHHMVSGSELLRQGRVEQAVASFVAALEVRPGEAKALALLGLAYFRGGQVADARPIYEELVARAPGDASYRLNLGLVHLKLGDANAAIGELEKSRDLDPSQGRAVSYLGLAYARAGNFVDAYGAFLAAGQNDLAREVEQHLTADAKARIEAHLARPAPSVSTSQRFIAIDAAPAAEADAEAPSESLRFVAAALDEHEPDAADAADTTRDHEPSAGRVARPLRAQTAISRAVSLAIPSAAAAGSGTRVAPGSRPPLPLSEFATSRLVRPEDGDYPFEISATGVLIVRVDGRMLTRTEGVDVTGGQLSYEPATRRSRGAQTGESFDTGGRPMFVVSGHGHLIASPIGGLFTAVQLDEDIFYLREDLVFAFEPDLRWENGHVPGSGSRLQMIQFRGSGSVAFRTERPLLAVKLAPERVLYVDAAALAGWIGRVVPRAVAPAGGGHLSELFVECTGEGVVLVQEEAVPAAQGGEPAHPPAEGS
jgi:tetratricopeptide (TPR) repeat protein/uncharacterized protein (AIM24 family)